MDKSSSRGQYTVIGGKTIIGKIFAYQEKTGMSIKEIMKIPYIMFVLGMADAPSIDYDHKKEGLNVPKTAEQEKTALLNFLH